MNNSVFDLYLNKVLKCFYIGLKVLFFVMLNSRFLDFPFYDIISDTIILVFFIILL